MSCSKCKGTDCIISSKTNLKDGTIVFADLRYDLEFNQFDIEFGSLNEDGYAKETEWSDAVDIKYCPFCGIKLEKTSFM